MKLDERGKQCPLPVIETKKLLERSAPGTVVEVLVDNEIAVQNLTKMAVHKGLQHEDCKLGEGIYQVRITAGAESCAADEEDAACAVTSETGRICKGEVVVLSAAVMGTGDDVLGKILMKGFVYALSQQDVLPETVLLYNGGAFLSTEGAETTADLQAMAAEGVEILTCGTCMNHYGLTEKLAVGGVTNMYDITAKMTQASRLIRP